MIWPLVSGRALAIVTDERDRLRAQVDRLLDHLTRMDRVEHGLHELAQQPAKPREPMPEELRALIDAFGSHQNRQQLKDAAFRLHAKGQSWESITAKIEAHIRSQDPERSSAQSAEA